MDCMDTINKLVCWIPLAMHFPNFNHALFSHSWCCMFKTKCGLPVFKICQEVIIHLYTNNNKKLIRNTNVKDMCFYLNTAVNQNVSSRFPFKSTIAPSTCWEKQATLTSNNPLFLTKKSFFTNSTKASVSWCHNLKNKIKQ